MKFYDVEPRSQEWFSMRLGVCTSSQFHRVFTPKTRKLSTQAPKYMAELIAEYISGEQIEGYQSEWMCRGQEVEDSIWKSYENYTESETSRGGFFTNNEGTLGASPDRLVGITGAVECKAPMLHTQVLYGLSDGPDDDYKVQLQGQLMISEREWCDVFSWHPRLFIPPIRVHRDEKFISELGAALDAFVETMLNARVLLEKNYGPFVRPEVLTKPADDPGEFGITDEDVDPIWDAAVARRGE